MQIMKIIPIRRYTVQGKSMLPALKPGQDVLVLTWFFEAKKWDIVVIKHGGREMIKRIQKVHDRKYFVEGDNKKESTDSRSFGPVTKDEIIGKVIWH